jgi:hypothetical protein
VSPPVAVEAAVPADAAPWFPVAPSPDAPKLERAERHGSRGLIAVAGVAGLGALGLYAAAGASRTAYDDLSDPRVRDDADLQALRTRTNAEVAGATGLGVAAVGLGVVAVVVGRF